MRRSLSMRHAVSHVRDQKAVPIQRVAAIRVVMTLAMSKQQRLDSSNCEHQTPHSHKRRRKQICFDDKNNDQYHNVILHIHKAFEEKSEVKRGAGATICQFATQLSK